MLQPERGLKRVVAESCADGALVAPALVPERGLKHLHEENEESKCIVAPALVLVGGLVSPKPFTLSFNRGEMGFLFISVLLGGLVVTEGRSSWFKGIQLLAVYAILAAVCYLVPAVAGE